MFFSFNARNSISFAQSGEVGVKKIEKALKNLTQNPYLCTKKEDSIFNDRF